MTWARSIAEAAKEGSCGQEKLDWDSYEREKSDIHSLHLQRKADKARASEIAKLRSEKAAEDRAENAARRAQLRKEKEEKAKIRELKALARKKSEEMKMKMVLSKGLKLKAKLSKVCLMYFTEKNFFLLAFLMFYLASAPAMHSDRSG